MIPGMRAVLFMALAGCQLVFPFESGDPALGVDAPPVCTQGFGATATEVEIDTDDDMFDPATSGDPTELWVTIEDKGRRIRVTRLGNMGFGTPVLAPFSDPSEDNDTDPALSSDGEVLLFLRDGFLFEVRRIEGTFGTPGSRVDVPDQLSGIDVSPDGLRVYFSDSLGIRMVERADRARSFGAPVDLGIPEGSFPSISSDELEVYYNAPGSIIKRRTRAGLDQKFGPEQSVFEGGGDLADAGDPEIDATGQRLLYSSSGELFELVRACR